MQEGKLPREALLRTTATIRGARGWEDPIESLSVHAYIAKSQHKALMEEKRRENFDDTREGNSSKWQTRGDKAREAASQELPVKDTSPSLEEKTRETKEKSKSIAYKLLSDIEAATNLKGVLEERYSDKKMEALSHYTRKHWARATTEILVKVGDIDESIVALVDHGSKINLMSKDLYKKQKWPIDIEHGWPLDIDSQDTTLVRSSQATSSRRRPRDEEPPAPRRRRRIPSNRLLVIIFEVEPAYDGQPEGVFGGQFHNEDTEVHAWSEVEETSKLEEEVMSWTYIGRFFEYSSRIFPKDSLKILLEGSRRFLEYSLKILLEGSRIFLEANLTRRTNLIQLRGHLDLTTRLLANMRPELVGRLNVVPITGLRFRFRLFRPSCRSGNVLSVKGSPKGSLGGVSGGGSSKGQGKLELLLEDKEEDEGLTTKWKNVEDAVGLLTKRERRKDRSNIPKTVQAPKAPVRTTPPTMPIVQPSTSLSTSTNNSKNVSKQGYVQRCIWCNDASHSRKDCNKFNNMIRQGIICWKEGKIALKDREDLLQTNFGKGRMRALVQDYLKEHETAAQESASYGARVDDDLRGSTKTSEFWTSTISTMQEGKLPREALLRTTATIRGARGWEDPIESLSVHAYIAKSQHKALMEEKRRENFDDTREGNSSKWQTRGDKAREAASQELPVKDTSPSLEEKTRETKEKSKSIAYKLLSDIEAATNLKGVLEERILNAKVEFTLKEVLGIVKKEFHDVIIDNIKRKRQ
uniref:Predicted protein n=1 Tax=Physcomitrium patens TaxID=3218 RepID=A9U1B4_PHYPA